jgi:DNA-binding PadR family transcriptional regulator
VGLVWKSGHECSRLRIWTQAEGRETVGLMAGISAQVDVRIARAIVGALRERDLSGFEIWRWLGSVRGAHGELDEANLYPTLHRLEAEGLLRSFWREDERTSRTYRLTASGLKEAQARGWGAVTYRRPAAGTETADAGEGEWVWSDAPARAQRGPAAGQPAEGRGPEAPEAALVDAFLDRLEASLQLSTLHCHDVCHEIADHLAASMARLQSSGLAPLVAAEQAVAALGPPEELARGISEAQLTTARLHSGLRWASAVATLTTLAGLAVAFAALDLLAPILSSLLVGLGPAFGLHLYAPEVVSWHGQELGLAGCVGAFLGGRRSMPQLALRSRRAEALVWRTWAVLGAVPLALAAILVPATLDPLTAATLLAIPVAWVVGVRRAAPLHGDVLSTRGVLVAALLMVAVTWLPGVRIWTFQPATTPPGGPPFAGQPLPLNWTYRPDTATWQVSVELPPGWHDPQLELRPAVPNGLEIAPDGGAATPRQVPYGQPIDSSTLRGAADWWVTVTAVGPDGARYTVATDVRLRGRAHYRGPILGWLLGRP